MSRLLKNKFGMIIGASSGIGRAAAQRFAEEGAGLVIVARREAALQSLAQQLRQTGADVRVIAQDVTQKTAARQLVEATCVAFGRIDFAFNNAGTIGNFVPMVDQSEEDFDETVALNLKSVWLLVQAQARQMREQSAGPLGVQGVIVNTSSWLSQGALHGSATYSATKAAVDGMMRACALEFAPHIRINNINPGGIDTEMTRVAFDHDEETLNAFARSHPLGRLGTPSEVAELAAFLISDKASNISGQAMAVDGGYGIAGQRGARS